MKKTILALTVIVAFTVRTLAQDLHFGFQLSPSFSKMSTDVSKINGSGAATGLKMAVIAENRFSQTYAITSGIGFHFNAGGRLLLDAPSRYWTKSWGEFDKKPNVTGDSAAFVGGTRFRYSINFVEIPIGLKMRTLETGSHIRYFLEPHLNFGFKSNAKGDIDKNTAYEQTKINIKSEVNFINLSWGIGGGGEYVINNNTAIVLGLYYQRGFSDITDNNGRTFDTDGKSNGKNDTSKGIISSVTVRLGVMF